MASTWDPDQYLKFHGPRIRPALDLLAQADVDDPETVYDLGCGPGNVTGFIQQRWPAADVIGVDASETMLAQARDLHPDKTWIQADLVDWAPDAMADVFYSNAVFQWLRDHDTLLPRLVANVRAGGIFAFQLPRNWTAPSHAIINDLVAAGPHRAQLEPLLLRDPVGPPDYYYGLLRPHVRAIDIWETEYLQILDGKNAVAEWTKGSVLKPLLDALADDAAAAFYDQYATYVASQYPQRPDGKTLYPFRRLFVVARR